jgi:hypothetical protein
MMARIFYQVGEHAFDPEAVTYIRAERRHDGRAISFMVHLANHAFKVDAVTHPDFDAWIRRRLGFKDFQDEVEKPKPSAAPAAH